MLKDKRFETINLQKQVEYHNTVCHRVHLRVCHKKCGVPYSQDSAVLTGCQINRGGKCKECDCPTTDHSHARVEYVTEKQESAEYKFLLQQIDLCKNSPVAKQAKAMATSYKEQMQQFENELVQVQKNVQKCLEEYGKHSLGPGYLRLLEDRLYYID